jgi:hypothetical protein
VSEQKIEEGWGAPACSRKWHYFRADGMSLCRKIGFYMGPREQGKDDHPDNCAACKKILASLRASAPLRETRGKEDVHRRDMEATEKKDHAKAQRREGGTAA